MLKKFILLMRITKISKKSLKYPKTSKMIKISLEPPKFLKCTMNVQNIPKTYK